jgi:hypothetical protein
LLTNLGAALHSRHTHTGSLVDLEGALQYYRQAVTCTPTGSPDFPLLLNNMGSVPHLLIMKRTPVILTGGERRPNEQYL